MGGGGIPCHYQEQKFKFSPNSTHNMYCNTCCYQLEQNMKMFVFNSGKQFYIGPLGSINGSRFHSEEVVTTS